MVKALFTMGTMKWGIQTLSKGGDVFFVVVVVFSLAGFSFFDDFLSFFLPKLRGAPPLAPPLI